MLDFILYLLLFFRCRITRDETPLPPKAATEEEDEALLDDYPIVEPGLRMDYGYNVRYVISSLINLFPKLNLKLHPHCLTINLVNKSLPPKKIETNTHFKTRQKRLRQRKQHLDRYLPHHHRRSHPHGAQRQLLLRHASAGSPRAERHPRPRVWKAHRRWRGLLARWRRDGLGWSDDW